METVLAFDGVQEIVDEAPGWMSLGDAEKEEMEGYILLGITLFDEEELEEVPARLVAETVNVYA